MRSDTIIGYTFSADTFCPACVVAQLPTGPGEEFDGWALADGAYMTTEDNLAELAGAFGIDRMDERSYDSGDFPKVIFADQFEADQCGACGRYLVTGWVPSDETEIDETEIDAVDPGQATLFGEEI